MENELICIIPCRSGSVRLENKNKREFLGKALYKWTVEQAIKIKEFDTIYVTTDDDDIIKGCIPYEEKDIRFKVIVRPSCLATPYTEPWAVVEHCCQHHLDNAIVILLQVTSPLRIEKDILMSIKLFESYGKKMGLMSLCYDPARKKIEFNGVIFIQYLGTIRNTKSFIHSGMIAYLMPPERSHDIDTREDFELAEREMRKRRKREND